MISELQLPWYQSLWNIFPVWGTIIMICYIVYAVFRTWYIFRETMGEGFFRGLFDVYIGNEGAPVYAGEGSERKIIGREPRYLRLYHIVWIVIDLPCIAVGSCLPFIRRMFTFKIAPVSRPQREEDL